MPDGTENLDRRTPSMSDFIRLEGKVDKMGTALEMLIRVEERQASESKRINELETETAVLREKLANLERKVDQWVNRGIGAWGLAVIVWGALKAFHVI